jgi:hypothetical protein
MNAPSWLGRGYERKRGLMFQKERGRHRVAPSPSVLAPEVFMSAMNRIGAVVRLHGQGDAGTTQCRPYRSPTARATQVPG